MSNYNAANAVKPTPRCQRCGQPMPATTGYTTICKTCKKKPGSKKPTAAATRRCRRCRQPIPMEQPQGTCKTCRQGLPTDAVAITCPDGHTFHVQARHGAVVKCAVCAKNGETVWVTVHRDNEPKISP